MKKTKFLIFAIIQSFFCILPFFSAETISYKPYELDSLIHEIEKPTAPVITDDYIIFTAEANYRFVGIAFDFEDYKVIHPYKILTKTDDDGTVSRKHLFYCYERQHKFTKIKYRIVMDGLWTTDPLNPQKEYDEETDLYFSTVEDPKSIRIQTEKLEEPKNGVKFIYKGESGLQPRLAGSFTNWDPWIYELKETYPGIYELTLPLPKGTYYYNYYIGFTPVLDSTNPQKAYTSDGRSASVLIID